MLNKVDKKVNYYMNKPNEAPAHYLLNEDNDCVVKLVLVTISSLSYSLGIKFGQCFSVLNHFAP